jgi:hypothetical protein
MRRLCLRLSSTLGADMIIEPYCMDEYEEYLANGKQISALINNYVIHAPNPDFGPESDVTIL